MSEFAYKFLRAGGEGPFTGFAWPRPANGRPGAWVSGTGAEACASGVHACRLGDLPVWLNDELWVAELAGEVTQARSKVVAPRGRLVRRVAGWTPARGEELSEACAFRARGHAVAALRASGMPAAADALAGFGLAELASAEALAPPRAPRVRSALGYAADAATHALNRARPAVVAYIAATAAAHAAGSPEGAAAERAWQAEWMRERLGLE